MGRLQNYQVLATDWREALRKNHRRTFIVILLFIIIYFCIGFLIDLFINASLYIETMPTSNIQMHENVDAHPYSSPYSSTTHYTNPNTNPYADVPWWGLVQALFTFQIIPLATIIMIIIAFISLGIALIFHQKIALLGTEYQEVTADQFNSEEERRLYHVIEELKIAAGLRFMPKVYIIDAPYMNAFASGLSEASSMVAITRGLLEKLDREELQAVMAHELSHIRHGDMQLTLMVMILSNIMLIAIDIVFRGVLYGSRDRKSQGLIFIVLILRFLLPVVTLLLMLYLSRTREYMADAGSVELLRDNEPIARALIKIDNDYKENQEHYQTIYQQTPHEEIREDAYLYDPKAAGLMTPFSLNSLFSSHPSLEERLRALNITLKKE